MKTDLIVMCGGMASGKDVIGDFIAENQDKPKFHFSFAEPLKNEVNDVLHFLKNYKNLNKVEALSNEFNIKQVDAAWVLETLRGVYLKYPDVNSRTREPEIRAILQVWGTGIRRKQNPNHWVELAEKKILEKLNEGYFVYITDGRFTNEFESVKNLGGKAIVLISEEQTRIKRIQERDGITPSKEALNHSSEQDWKIYDNFDIEINNDKQSVKETQQEVLKKLRQ